MLMEGNRVREAARGETACLVAAAPTEGSAP